MFKTYIGITRIYISPLYIIYVHRTGKVLSVNFFRINDDTVVGFKCKKTVVRLTQQREKVTKTKRLSNILFWLSYKEIFVRNMLWLFTSNTIKHEIEKCFNHVMETHIENMCTNLDGNTSSSIRLIGCSTSVTPKDGSCTFQTLVKILSKFSALFLLMTVWNIFKYKKKHSKQETDGLLQDLLQENIPLIDEMWLMISFLPVYS
jgi:hypothetical protein